MFKNIYECFVFFLLFFMLFFEFSCYFHFFCRSGTECGFHLLKEHNGLEGCKWISWTLLLKLKQINPVLQSTLNASPRWIILPQNTYPEKSQKTIFEKNLAGGRCPPDPPNFGWGGVTGLAGGRQPPRPPAFCSLWRHARRPDVLRRGSM